MFRSALVFVLVVGSALVLWAGMGEPLSGAEPSKESPEVELSRAEGAFRVKNYNEAIRLAKGFLKEDLGASDAMRAERLIGLSQFGLQKWQAAYRALSDLVERHPEMAKDAAVVEGIALSGIRSGRLHGPKGVDWLNKGIGLYEAEGNDAQQLSLLFVLADYYRDHSHLEGGTRDWRERQLDATARALATFDRALKVGGTIENQLRALRGKVDTVLRLGNVRPSEGAAAPAGIATVYDLSRPYALAIEFLEEIIRRWPDRPSAAESLVQIGDIQANHLQDYVAAVATYEEVVKRFGRTNNAALAKKKIAGIRAPQITITVPMVTVPGQKVRYHWYSRNTKTIEVAAYPVDLFAVLRRVQEWSDLARYPLEGKPAASWTIATGDKGDYAPLNSGEEPVEAPLSESNAYLLVAKGQSPDGKKVEARAMALVSRLGVVAKTGQSKSIWFAMDTLTGEPQPKTELLVQRFVRQIRVPVLNTTKNEYAYHEITVPDNGLAELGLPPRSNDHWEHQMIAIARRGKDYAVTDAGYWGHWWGYGDGFQVYSMTDRPVYRPDQVVAFKHILREYKKGTFANLPNRQVKVTIRDARGATIYEKSLVSNENGSIHGEFKLGSEPALGMYSMVLESKGVGLPVGPGASFRVEEYKKPEFAVSIQADKPLYRVGDRMQVRISGEYYFGGPVVGASVSYTVHRESFQPIVPWPRPYDWFYDDAHDGRFWWGDRRSDMVQQGELETDAQGNAILQVPTEPFANTPNGDLQYRIEVKMVDESRREIAASQTIKVTQRAFFVSLEPRRGLYQPGDVVRVGVKSQNANNVPVAFEGTSVVSFVEQREQRDNSGNVKQEEKLQELSSSAISVGVSGEGEIEFVADKQGLYKVVVHTADPFTEGGTITGSTYIWVAKGTGEFAHYANREIELVLENRTVRVGESLRMLVNCRHKDAYVLLVAEGDDIYKSEVVYIDGTQTTVEWPVERAFQPNIMVRAHTFRDNQIFQDERDVQVPPVEQFLTVKILAEKETYRPREEAPIEVEITDWEGKPAANTELSLGVFDASILSIQPETRGDIRKFFYGHVRPVSVRTTSSYAFRAWTSGRQNWGMDQLNGRAVGFGAGGEDGMPQPTSAALKAEPMMDAEAAAAPADAPPGEQGAFAATEVRSDFRDTVFWAADLKTDSAGKASATITFPDSLTLWRLTAVAADRATRVGEVKHEVRTKKNILVRLQTPRFLVEGDRVVLSAIAHNYLDQPKRVRVDMTEYSGLSLLGVNSSEWSEVALPVVLDSKAAIQDVEIPAGGEARVDFVFLASRFGTAKVTAKALTDVESDAMQLEIPVYEYGAEKLLAESGTILGTASSRTASARLEIPTEIRDGSQSLTLTMSPTIAGVMLESLPFLLEYPYGCTEQTMSRFLPAVLTSHTLHKLGLDLESLEKIPSSSDVVRERLERFRKNPVFDSKELEKMIRAGVARLRDSQQPDGGWGWWKGSESSPYISAYVVSGLALASESDVALPDRMLERGVEYLVALAGRAEPIHDHPWQRGENTSLRAYVLYAIGQANAKRLSDPPVAKSLRRVFEERDNLTDYGRALTAIALADAEMLEEAQLVLSNIKDRVRLDKETETASWGDARGFLYWYQGGTEATSYSLRALIRLEPSSPLIPKIVHWLVRNRQGTRWFNTKDTAIVSYALADYLAMSGELDPDLTLIAELDGKELRRVRVTKENIFTFDGRIDLSGEVVGTGAKEIVVRAEGRGNVYWGAYATYFTKESKIESGGNELFVSRSYQRLIPKTVTKTREVFDPETRKRVKESYQAIEYERSALKEGDSLASGDLIEVVLSIDARNNFEYLLFEDPKPAGCEPTELRSGYQWGGGFGAHTELRDEKVAFFASSLNQGKHKIAYRLRAEIPGQFHALPAHGESMYAPFVRGNGESWTFRISDAAE